MVGNIVYTPRRSLTEADVVDNLLSTATNLPLSAAQGKELNRTKADNDDLSKYLPLNGGELTGRLVIKSNGQKIRVYDLTTGKSTDYSTNQYGSYIRNLDAEGKEYNYLFLASDGRNLENCLIFRHDGTDYKILHSGNVGKHAIPITGGAVKGTLIMDKELNPNAQYRMRKIVDGKEIILALTIGEANGALLHLLDSEGNILNYINVEQESGKIGTKGGHTLLHTGISKPVAIQSTTPTDTTALWVDTATKSIKCYINGTWQKLSY